MPMPPYPVTCYRRDCGRLAVYKIAARWSDGVTSELKTYALSCEACLPEFFRQARQKQAKCRTTRGESLDPPSVFQMAHGQRDRALLHLPELEAQLLAAESLPGDPPVP